MNETSSDIIAYTGNKAEPPTFMGTGSGEYACFIALVTLHSTEKHLYRRLQATLCRAGGYLESL